MHNKFVTRVIFSRAEVEMPPRAKGRSIFSERAMLFSRRAPARPR